MPTTPGGLEGGVVEWDGGLVFHVPETEIMGLIEGRAGCGRAACWGQGLSRRLEGVGGSEDGAPCSERPVCIPRTAVAAAAAAAAASGVPGARQRVRRGAPLSPARSPENSRASHGDDGGTEN